MQYSQFPRVSCYHLVCSSSRSIFKSCKTIDHITQSYRWAQHFNEKTTLYAFVIQDLKEETDEASALSTKKLTSIEIATTLTIQHYIQKYLIKSFYSARYYTS